MFLTKTKKSTYYQIVYFINGRQTTKSTREKNYRRAKAFLQTHQHSLAENYSVPTIQRSKRLLKQQEIISIDVLKR